MTTKVFKSYIEFAHREDKKVNGVSESFAADHPEFEKDNAKNKGCWDCRFCYRCTDCTDCNDCLRCTGCTKCADCTRCIRCYRCTDCEECNRCIECIRCEDCEDCIDLESEYDAIGGRGEGLNNDH